MSDNAIFDGWAEAYEIIHESGNESVWDGRDLDFYSEEADAADGTVLEIGCGTGRVTLPLLEDGHDVRGIDLSEDQLRILRSKAEDRGLDHDVRQGDMRSFDHAERYDLIIVPYNTFRHNLTLDDQLRTLDNVQDHLTDDGKAIIEFFSPELKHRTTETVKTSEFTYEGDDFFFVKSFQLADDIEQILRFGQKLYRNGTLLSENEYKYSRIYKRGFVNMLHRSGFEDWKLYGSFDREPLEANGETQNMIWELTQ